MISPELNTICIWALTVNIYVGIKKANSALKFAFDKAPCAGWRVWAAQKMWNVLCCFAKYRAHRSCFAEKWMRECTTVHDRMNDDSKARDVPRDKAKMAPAPGIAFALRCAALLRLPFGVEPPCWFGSFFAAQKMRNVSIPQIQSYRSISFAPNFIWAKKWLRRLDSNQGPSG